MRQRTWIYGGLSAAILAGLFRFGGLNLARWVQGRETKSSSSRSCGRLVWRRETVMRKPLFDSVPEYVGGTSVVEADGRVFSDSVQELHCLLGRNFSKVAVLVHLVDQNRQMVTIVDADSVRPAGTRHFAHEIDESWPSDDGSFLAARSPQGEISVTSLQDDSPPVALFSKPPALGAAVAWLDDATLCWVASERSPSTHPAADANAELWCAKLPGAPKRVAQAVWPASSDRPPWPGLHLGQAHLCGDGLVPRDPECVALVRKRD